MKGVVLNSIVQMSFDEYSRRFWGLLKDEE